MNNLRENLNNLIQNATSNFSNKISALKKQIEDKMEKSARESASLRGLDRPRKKTATILDIMVLKDIVIMGEVSSKPARSRSESKESGKQNELSHSSKRPFKEKDGDDFASNNLSKKQSAKDDASGALPLKSHVDDYVQDKDQVSQNSMDRHSKPDKEKTKNLEELVAALRKHIKEKDEEIKGLHKVVLEQHNQLKEFENIDRDEMAKNGTKSRMEESQEYGGDMSIDSEDLNVADPSKIARMIKSLRQEEHLLNQRLIILREEIDDLSKEKVELVEESRLLKKDSKKLNAGQADSLRRAMDSKGRSLQEGTLVQSEGDEDFSNYFILKNKFDEIHAFITRIAGLLSKSVQYSRRRHATPELKDAYLGGGSQKIESLKSWLQNSPSKAQIDKDSKRFYLKFKKRLDTSKLL